MHLKTDGLSITLSMNSDILLKIKFSLHFGRFNHVIMKYFLSKEYAQMAYIQTPVRIWKFLKYDLWDLC
jgi:hypothetical protein